MSLYCTTRGPLEDLTTPLLCNVFGYDPHRPEYNLAGEAYDLALTYNRRLGVNKVEAHAHSNGDHVALMGTNKMADVTQAEFVSIMSLGGVGDKRKASTSFKYHDCYIEDKDYIAKIGRGFLDSSHVHYVRMSKTFGLHNHYIDCGTYADMNRQFYRRSYTL